MRISTPKDQEERKGMIALTSNIRAPASFISLQVASSHHCSHACSTRTHPTAHRNKKSDLAFGRRSKWESGHSTGVRELKRMYACTHNMCTPRGKMRVHLLCVHYRKRVDTALLPWHKLNLNNAGFHLHLCVWITLRVCMRVRVRVSFAWVTSCESENSKGKIRGRNFEEK